ncbi:hypothetical protein CLOSTMETH_02441 [[Clostridium] methylpentosum DSM 5476]|uniref:Uncharacterized protein n=1 Tax=[Clostridium] methylpentosum DSM 5476 TaxID=537013 RepID=C0EF02_9FIRM|nr:hypothetical protein CLOSTMETH_02441 [[Clostridium] methylpentosum DSM 5476]
MIDRCLLFYRVRHKNSIAGAQIANSRVNRAKPPSFLSILTDFHENAKTSCHSIDEFHLKDL